MRILERYINNSVIIIFAATVFIFCFLYVLIDVTSQLDEFIDRRVPVRVLAQYYLAFLPIILVRTSPIACLIATLLTFSRLNNHNEIIAMRSGGLNFWQITKPALCFSLMISAAVFWINEYYVPRAALMTSEIRNAHMVLKIDREKKSKIRNLTFYGLKNRLYFIDNFDPATQGLEGITIIAYDQNQNISEKIVALKGHWTGIAWKFFQCQITSFGPENINKLLNIKVYKEKLMDIPETPDDFLKQRLDVTSMNIRQLKGHIDRFSSSGATKALNSLQVDLYHKIAFPIGNFVIVFIGLPLALMVRSRKGMTFTSMGIAVIIGFLYFVMEAVALAFGKGSLLPPFLSAWTAPLIFSATAFLLIESNF